LSQAAVAVVAHNQVLSVQAVVVLADTVQVHSR
jgi:hypothetical protein